MSNKIRSHRDLEVYQKAFTVARRSSRSVCANLGEAWRKRRYEKAFISKLSDCEGEASETQVWLEFAVSCGYMTKEDGNELYKTYNDIIGTLIGMINHPETWIIGYKHKSR